MLFFSSSLNAFKLKKKDYAPIYGIVISLSSCPETVPFSRIYLEISFVVSRSREGAFWKKNKADEEKII